MIKPFLVRVEAEVKKVDKAKKAGKAKKVQKPKQASKAKILNGKRKTKPQQAVGRNLPTNNFSQLKKLLPAIGKLVEDPELDSFTQSSAWKNFIRKWAPSIVAAFFADTKIIKSGEEQQFLRYVKNQVKPVTT